MINLLAADCVELIATTLGRVLIVSEYAARELTHDPRDNADGQEVIGRLAANGTLKIATLDDGQLTHFYRLVGAPPPDDLGDGEAATLACAAFCGIAVIDEKKATRIAMRDYPNVALYTTLDLLCADQMYRTHGAAHVHDMVTNALTVGRMRIPHAWRSRLDSNITVKSYSAMANGSAICGRVGSKGLIRS
ncbi:hypothetical protein CKA38_09900 [Ereboglobus luteus]|uniref:Uncharacterized protein n=1 Tax=Ereboglobus luteus TaxID=1796921 RepID=A0A2U8E421_9BACT|nr:hypothetical protein CKA38_09900 [Ereboglobus luteus]